MKHKLLSVDKPNVEGFVFDLQTCLSIFNSIKSQIANRNAVISHENSFNLDLTTVIGKINAVEMVDGDIFIEWEFLPKFTHLSKYPVKLALSGTGKANSIHRPIGVTNRVFRVSNFTLSCVVFKIT